MISLFWNFFLWSLSLFFFTGFLTTLMINLYGVSLSYLFTAILINPVPIRIIYQIIISKRLLYTIYIFQFALLFLLVYTNTDTASYNGIDGFFTSSEMTSILDPEVDK